MDKYRIKAWNDHYFILQRRTFLGWATTMGGYKAPGMGARSVPRRFNGIAEAKKFARDKTKERARHGKVVEVFSLTTNKEGD